MSIFVVEYFHDNDAAIFATKESALAFVQQNKSDFDCIAEYELRGDEYVRVGNWSLSGEFFTDAQSGRSSLFLAN